jgi:hypothetical protein
MGNENWSGSSLQGTAASYGGSYSKSRGRLFNRIKEIVNPLGLFAWIANVLYGLPRRWHRELVFGWKDNPLGTFHLWRGAVFEDPFEPIDLYDIRW